MARGGDSRAFFMGRVLAFFRVFCYNEDRGILPQTRARALRRLFAAIKQRKANNGGILRQSRHKTRRRVSCVRGETPFFFLYWRLICVLFDYIFLVQIFSFRLFQGGAGKIPNNEQTNKELRNEERLRRKLKAA
jgi:hypothetical protein